MASSTQMQNELKEKLQAATRLQSQRLNQNQPRTLKPLIDPISLDAILADLDKADVLYDSSPERPEKGLKVFCALGSEIPNLLRELGRLREETFRTVGEGTGKSHDNDHFDPYYLQLVGWDKKTKQITGAYRLGQVDKILQNIGPHGVYTNQLFDLEQLLKTDFKTGTLEAGRSFVRPEFQRGPTLFVIWIAIASYIQKNPHYKNLMGPVSISNEFQENSKHLIVHYLMNKFPHEKSNLVSSKNPPKFDSELTPAELTMIVDEALDLSQLQEFVRMAENDTKVQIPQLIKLYLDLGVRFLAFYKDEDFNSIDGLIWTDITKLPLKVLQRYMGSDGAKAYLKTHSISFEESET